MASIKKQLTRAGIKFKYVEGKSPRYEIKACDTTINYYVHKAWWQGVGFPSGRGLMSELIELIKKREGEETIDFYNNNPEAYNHIIGVFQKHFGKKIPERLIEPIKQDLERKFDISLKNK